MKDVVGYSDVRIKTAIWRLALPRRWWQFRCLAGKGDTHGYLWAFAHSFFTDFREIYIIQDFEEEPHQQHSKVSECTANLDSLLPISVRADLQRIGWNVELAGDKLKVTRSGSEFSTRIQDYYQGKFTSMDLTTIESPRKDSFFLLAPDVVYYMSRSCTLDGPQSVVAVTAQQQNQKDEEEDDDDW